MVDTDCKRKMVSPDLPTNSPKLSSKLHVTIPSPFKLPVSSPISCSAPSSCSAYELYLRLPELKNLWCSRDFPNWTNEPILKPALQALEITFRLVLAVCSDTRPYINHREWNRRLDSLVTNQIKLISSICEEEEEEEGEATPVSDGRSSLSLLPQLATWRKSEAFGKKILSTIDNEMRLCKYTLGLGEQNVAGKPNLQYDTVCKPNEVYNLRENPYADHIDNSENETLYILHQIIESWLHASGNLLTRINTSVDEGRFKEASRDVYLVERIWKLLTEVEDLHILMDPEDFLKLKKQLHIKTTGKKNDAFCFRSRGLVETMKMSKGLREKVPTVLECEVDPTGGPRLQEAAMRLYARKGDQCDKIHLLQGMQAVEAAAKRFFFGYKQLVAVMMGSAEMNMDCDSVSQIFMEPTYFPSLDAAKTFLGEFWCHVG